MTLDDLRTNPAAVLSVTQTAALLSDLDGNTLDERTVRRACEDGQLPCIRVGRRLLIPREPLLALLTTSTHNGAEPDQDSATAHPEQEVARTRHGVTNQLRT